MTNPPRRMKIGINMVQNGAHNSGWRHPDADAGIANDFKGYARIIKAAEEQKIDFMFLADGAAVRIPHKDAEELSRHGHIDRFEPLTLLAAVAAVTDRIGLICTASTTYNEPYALARKFASLDHISDGRAGWNVVTSWSDQEALNFNRTENLPREARYGRAAEFVEVVKGLWNSWDADAFTHDKASGQFYDPEKLHVLDHRGPHFQVRGPLNSCRTPQGRPLIVQAGASNQGRDIAAEHADVVYSVSQTVEEARAFYADLKARAAEFGRLDNAPLIMPGITIYTGATQAEAQARFDELQALIDPLAGLNILYTFCGDLSGHDLDGPLPEHLFEGRITIGSGLLAKAKAENLTIRQLYESAAAGFTGRYIIGTAETVVDDLQHWFETGAADGFNICPPILPQGMADMSRFILPELRRRGLFRTDYEGATLRQNLGLG